MLQPEAACKSRGSMWELSAVGVLLVNAVPPTVFCILKERSCSTVVMFLVQMFELCLFISVCLLIYQYVC